MNPSLREIDIAICARFNLMLEQLWGRERRRFVARPRQIGMFLARELTTKSLPQIGRHYGRDHSTVHKNLRRVSALILTNPKVAAYADECRSAVLAAVGAREISDRARVEALHRGVISWPASQEAA